MLGVLRSTTDTQCWPGVAEAGTATLAFANDPFVPAATNPWRTPSKYSSSGLPAGNIEPLTPTLPDGGTNAIERLMPRVTVKLVAVVAVPPGDWTLILPELVGGSTVFSDVAVFELIVAG